MVAIDSGQSDPACRARACGWSGPWLGHGWLSRCDAVSWALLSFTLATGCGPDGDQQKAKVDAVLSVSDVQGGGTFDAGGRTPTFKCEQDADCAVTAKVGACESARCLAGKCFAKPKFDGDPCDDGDACTENDRCLGGTCQPGLGRSCDDDNPCTADDCIAATGACAVTATEGGCEPEKPCQLGVCRNAACQGSPALAEVDFVPAPLELVRGPSHLLWVEAADPVAPPATSQRLVIARLDGEVVATVGGEPIGLSEGATRLSDAVADGPGFALAGADLGPQGATSAAPRGVFRRIAASGATLATATLAPAGGGAFASLAVRGDGLYVLAGSRMVTGGAIQEGWLATFDGKGAQKLDFFYAGPTSIGLLDVHANGTAALLAGWQRAADGASDRPLLIQAGSDGAVTSLAQPALKGRGLGCVRRHGGTIALLIGGDSADGVGGNGNGGLGGRVLLYDGGLQPLANVALSLPTDLAAIPGLTIPAGGVLAGWQLKQLRVLGVADVVVAGHFEIDHGASAMPKRVGALARVGPLGAVQWIRALPGVAGVASVAVTTGQNPAIWLAGDKPGMSPAGRMLRVDGFGHSTCQEAGLCHAAPAGCDDGDPCTLDLCDSSLGCNHPPVADGIGCGIGKMCAVGVCKP